MNAFREVVQYILRYCMRMLKTGCKNMEGVNKLSSGFEMDF